MVSRLFNLNNGPIKFDGNLKGVKEWISVSPKIKRDLIGKQPNQKPNFNMNLQDQIEAYLNSHPEPKRSDMNELHTRILQVYPDVNCGMMTAKMPTIRLLLTLP